MKMRNVSWFPSMLVVRGFGLITALFLTTATAHAEWRIEYTKDFRALMSRIGRPVPQYVGNYATREECQAAIRRAESGDPSLQDKMKAVDVGGAGASSSSQQPQYQPSAQPGPDVAKQKREYQEMAVLFDQTVGKVGREGNDKHDKFDAAKKNLAAVLKDNTKPQLSLKDSPSAPASQLTALQQLETATMLSFLAARAKGSGNANVARSLSEFAATAQQGYETAKKVPDVPQPTPVQKQLYEYVVQETKTVSAEKQTVDRLLSKALKKCEAARGKVKDLTVKIENLKQPPVPPPTTTKPTPTKEEKDKLADEAQAVLNEALNEAEAEKQKKENEVNVLAGMVEAHDKRLTELSQAFATAREHPERSEELMKELQGDKR